MKFSWLQFAMTAVQLAPVIVAGTAALTKETGKVSIQQEATDALNLATGISGAVLSQNPEDAALASAASQITALIIAETSQLHASQGLPNLEGTPAPPTPAAPAPTLAAASAQPV